MYSSGETRIDESHFELLAEHGEQVALIGTVNLEVEQIVGVLSFHEYEGTMVVQSGHPNTRMDRLDTYSRLVQTPGSTADMIQEVIRGHIRDQKQSDDDTPFTWELITGTDEVLEDEGLQDVLETVVSPERLEPDFEIPDDALIAVVDTSYEGYEILKEAINYRAGVPVDIHQHRGDTYLVGITEDHIGQISNAVYELQMEYKNNGLYESAETADRLESTVNNAIPKPKSEAV